MDANELADYLSREHEDDGWGRDRSRFWTRAREVGFWDNASEEDDDDVSEESDESPQAFLQNLWENGGVTDLRTVGAAPIRFCSDIDDNNALELGATRCLLRFARRYCTVPVWRRSMQGISVHVVARLLIEDGMEPLGWGLGRPIPLKFVSLISQRCAVHPDCWEAIRSAVVMERARTRHIITL